MIILYKYGRFLLIFFVAPFLTILYITGLIKTKLVTAQKVNIRDAAFSRSSSEALFSLDSYRLYRKISKGGFVFGKFVLM